MRKKNYHDYVIKHGKFIGEFDKMYQDFEDPWKQSEQPNRVARAAGIECLKKHDCKKVLEAGCGLGYYAERMYQETGNVPISVDLSSTAIEKAQINFPHLNFKVADISSELEKFKEVDCVLLSEIMWYILDDLDDILTDLRKHFKGKKLLINQVFYKGTQQYGTEFFTNLDELVEYIPFQLVDKISATQEGETTIETSSMYLI